ncbi:bifunctional DNA-formamidopyrimidine glycosylase/DNA-(apurinic or apyrimidinic site) lyase [Promicromonospora thailandica]|uniref:Formamidopyrimidine-DNA glycosylase n=1 Tax=Promicromonospora thailandica TaxID=765201 RepID=A0A9X2G268_9MICO|nr:bifunctional DNA-formamidopyrimidine glycosylase/DNA-(apurinic or apyrimidinic site) lyase [Promicromonospora thailandica]MCP2264323.1 formamidopyrimidine-DNA glycosylase [Promicromonospora thailandica]BFF20989.1 bifunctional DNA-formamidopyrimidine glycosylase/DNA-(apurinic or apyrimidinic site) lyase [Promicromonospora thailandica]
MPELPEVETVRDGLDRLVVGAVVRDVEVFREYSVRRHDGGPASFRGQLVGRRLTAAVRRGKFLWLPLAPPDVAAGDPAAALLAHLGMSGQLLVRGAAPSAVSKGGAPAVDGGAAGPDGAAPGPDGATPADDWRHPHLRVRLHLAGAPSGARYLDFVDQRTFGHLSVQDLVPDGDPAAPSGVPAGYGSDLPVLPEPVAHIARDLLDPNLDLDALVRRVRRRRTQVKRALLDQTVVSGVGNIYADEALWRAQVHWARATDRLRAGDVRRVLDAAAEVMREALAQGGTSFDDLYVNVNGQSGYFERSLAVYGRENEECRRCGTPVRRDAFMNRSSFSCPVCQPRPRGLPR